MKCKRKDDQSIVADRICEKGAVKPQDEMACNTQACTPRFVNELCFIEGLTLRNFSFQDKINLSTGVNLPLPTSGCVYHSIADGA